MLLASWEGSFKAIVSPYKLRKPCFDHGAAVGSFIEVGRLVEFSQRLFFSPVNKCQGCTSNKNAPCSWRVGGFSTLSFHLPQKPASVQTGRSALFWFLSALFFSSPPSPCVSSVLNMSPASLFRTVILPLLHPTLPLILRQMCNLRPPPFPPTCSASVVFAFESLGQLCSICCWV